MSANGNGTVARRSTTSWRSGRQYGPTITSWKCVIATLPFPFADIEAPRFEIRYPMTLATFGDFLRTQSATERYRTVVGTDPVPEFESSVVQRWGGRDVVREVRFPMFVRAGRPE